MKQLKKSLKDLNLLDRFLFAEAMEDPEIMKAMLEIILGKDIVLKYLPQTEKELRTSPLSRFVKLDVWAIDEDDVIYDTEAQSYDTGNLPRRSRLYQGMIDGNLLSPGEVDFNRMNPVFIIMIMPFDLFGQGKYRYTFQMRCEELPGMLLNDGATRIFLNTHGQNDDEVSTELVELLRFMENTTVQADSMGHSERLLRMQKCIAEIKSNKDVGVRYMQKWEELAYERQEGREEGIQEGRAEGIRIFIQDNLSEGKTSQQTIEKLMAAFSLPEKEAENYVHQYRE